MLDIIVQIEFYGHSIIHFSVICRRTRIDELVKSLNLSFSVIPAKAGHEVKL